MIQQTARLTLPGAASGPNGPPPNTDAGAERSSIPGPSGGCLPPPIPILLPSPPHVPFRPTLTPTAESMQGNLRPPRLVPRRPASTPKAESMRVSILCGVRDQMSYTGIIPLGHQYQDSGKKFSARNIGSGITTVEVQRE